MKISLVEESPELGRSKKINLPKTSGFLREEYQVWEILNSGTTLVWSFPVFACSDMALTY